MTTSLYNQFLTGTYMVENAGNRLMGSIACAVVFAIQGAYGQAAVPQEGKSIVYYLPTKTTATITRLLTRRTPTYVALTHQDGGTILLSFSFQPRPRIVQEYQHLLRTGNRFLRINQA